MKKYIFLLVLIPALAGITLYSLRNIDNTKRSITSGNKFYKVLFSKKDIKLSEEIDPNWKYLANFESAFNHISNSTPADAASIYSDMVDNEAVPNVLRELAQYLEVMNLLYRGEIINEGKVNNLESSMVYPYSSKEAIAIIKIHNNDIKGAIEILHSLLNDRKCPTLIKAMHKNYSRYMELIRLLAFWQRVKRKNPLTNPTNLIIILLRVFVTQNLFLIRADSMTKI